MTKQMNIFKRRKLNVKIFFLSLSFSLNNLLSTKVGLTLQGLTIPMPMDQMLVSGARGYGPAHKTQAQGRTSLNLWLVECQSIHERQYRTEHRQRIQPVPGENLKNLISREPNPSYRIGRQGF